MSDEFSKRYSTTSNTSSKPECYGDEDYYDRDDRTCRACPSVTTCGLVIRRKQKREENSAPIARRNSPTGGKTPTKRTKIGSHSLSEVDPEPGDTFGEVALHNSSLNALQGFVDTISDAVSHIPRKRYTGNIFGRGKKE